MKLSMRIIGIDPGYGRMGYGLVEKKGSDWTHVAHGCIETSAKVEFSERLLQIHNELKRLITRHNPDRAAVEDLFFAKNVKTAMQVGRLGVILLTLFQAGLTVDEYTPLQVKQAITGYGRVERASAENVGYSLKITGQKTHPG